ncbi:CheY-like chemotaxis protein [Deinococcus metalli]|nr:response regulator [Deinococcus metalli]MBB5376388.1 CheY-like chemotaxis protein [Deinococcus metalli]
MTLGAPPSIPSSRGQPLRVLIVDDNPMDRLLAREAFGGHENGVVVDTCASGERALNFLRELDTALPDVMLLDLNMPGLHGFDVLAQMKDDPRLALIPVVILSTSGNAGDVQQAYTLHASSYLVKDHDFASFARQIDAFVNFWMQARTSHTP